MKYGPPLRGGHRPPPTPPVDLSELDGPIGNDPSWTAPPGIPPDLWALQTRDTIVWTPVGARAAWPGQRVVKIDLPLRFAARPWRLLVSPTTNRDNGTDPLIYNDEVPFQQNMVTPAAYPPTAPSDANDSNGASLVVKVGSELIRADYPSRGATYSVSTNSLEVYVFEPEFPPAGQGLQPVRYHVQVQPGNVGERWDLWTRTIVHESVPAPAGVERYLMTSIPPRAVSVRFNPNDVNGDPLYARIEWFDANATMIESFQLTNANGANYPRWLSSGGPAPWPVPQGAAYFVARRTAFALGGDWEAPRTIWQLSI